MTFGRTCQLLSGVILKHVLNNLDTVYQALSDPTRRAIVERLTLGSASVSELARPLPMSLPAVVQHLAVLQASGLVRSEKIGRVRTCRIEPKALGKAEDWIAQRREDGSAARPARRLSGGCRRRRK